MTLTKGELIKILQEDKMPMDTKMDIYLECTNNDTGIFGNITDVKWSKNFKSLLIQGEYEEDND